MNEIIKRLVLVIMPIQVTPDSLFAASGPLPDVAKACVKQDAVATTFPDQLEVVQSYTSAGKSSATSACLGDVTPFPHENAQDWAQRVANRYAVEPKKAATDTIDVELPVNGYAHYVELQKQLASCFTDEKERPNISLTLRGSREAPQKCYGLLGGIGPLSDADILEKSVVELLSSGQDLRGIQIKLYSNPHPPRSIWALFRWTTVQYVMGVWNFLNHVDVDEFLIGSNTAHMHYDFLNWISGSRVFNAIRHVCEIVDRATAGVERVLVLGTTAAYHGQLYPHALQDQGLDVLTPNPHQQDQTQAAINDIKAGQIKAGRDRLKAILREIAEQDVERAKGAPLTHVLLGCTELPMALSPDDVSESLGYRVGSVDTAQVFARRIVSYLSIDQASRR